MGCTDDGKARIAPSFRVAPLLTVGYGIAHIGEILMTVGTDELVIFLAIEEESFSTSKLKTADTNSGDSTVESSLSFEDACGQSV